MGTWALAEYLCLLCSQWTDSERCFPLRGIYGLSPHRLYEEPWHCAARECWGSPPPTREMPELGLFPGLCLRCLYTSKVWCSRYLAAHCRRPLLVPWLSCFVQRLSFPKSKVFFHLIWNVASPGTWDILQVPGTVTSLRPSLSSGDWPDHKTVE